MYKAYKFRLYPSKEQEALLAKHFGYNQYLVPQELRDFKPLERKALTKRNHKKSISETVLDELGKKKSHSEMEASIALAIL